MFWDITPGFWLTIVSARVMMAVVQPTSGPPDEYWQGPEVAYHLVYGKGDLTWEWEYGLRSWLHPMLYAAPLAAGRALGVDNQAFVLYAPRVLQGLLAGAADVALHRLTRAMYAKDVERVPITNGALLFSLTNWFTWYCATRTLSNSVELPLSLLALAYLLEGREWRFLHAAGLATLMRPTSVVLWVVCAAFRLVQRRRAGIVGFIARGAAVTALWLAVGVAVDYAATGRLYVSQVEFFRFNFLEGKSALFGTHPWHWYATQGLPAMLGGTLFFAGATMWHTAKWCWRDRGSSDTEGPTLVFGLIAACLAAYSVVGHKEFRFLLTVLYLCFPLCSKGLNDLRWRLPLPVPTNVHLQLMVWVNILMVTYFCFFHQRGGVDAVGAVAHLESLVPAEARAEMVLVDSILPCYTTPGLSYLHGTRVAELRQFDCSPVGAAAPGATQHDVFRREPAAVFAHLYSAWNESLAGVFPAVRDLPEYMLLSADQLDLFRPVLAAAGYSKRRNVLHSPTPMEPGVGTHVLVISKKRREPVEAKDESHDEP